MNCKTCGNYKEHLYLDITASPETCVNYKPKEHEWERGDWAYSEKEGVVKILGLYTGFANCSRTDNTFAGSIFLHDLRSLTPADWTRQVDGVKYRAYEDERGTVFLYMSGMQNQDSNRDWSGIPRNRSFCRLAHIPIMPYELSQGKYEYSK